MKYILKCGKTYNIANPGEETGIAPLLLPIELARKYLDEKYQQYNRPMPEECANCPRGNKFTYPTTFVKKVSGDFVEIPAEQTVCYAVLDPEYRRQREQVIEELMAARRLQLEEEGEDPELDDVLQFLAGFSEKHFRFVPGKAHRGNGYEPVLEVNGVLYPSSETDAKIMYCYNIEEEVYHQLADSTGQIYDKEAMWTYWKTEKDCQRFIDLLQSLVKLTKRKED
jgi:hypothetical protein